MKKTKKIIALLLTLVLAVTAFTACGGSSESEDTKKVLVIQENGTESLGGQIKSRLSLEETLFLIQAQNTEDITIVDLNL